LSTASGARRRSGLDTVFCTHPHIDHVGWNTQRADGRWGPTFPNARYLVRRAELADLLARRDAGTAPAMHVGGWRTVSCPSWARATGYELARGLVLTPLLGHTAGQMGLRIDRPGGRAILCGDAVHSPAQIFQPGVSTSSCDDPVRAAATGQILLEEAAATGRVWAGPAKPPGRAGASHTSVARLSLRLLFLCHLTRVPVLLAT
jgi:glyoxylase-like metal-dependent hydrolase (beta-lactamase superfamily II)